MTKVLLGFLLVCLARDIGASDASSPVRAASAVAPVKRLADALSPEKWRLLENSVDHALAWLATQQAPNGSFPTLDIGQPAVTSLCVMAFLSRGHQPGLGPYGRQLNHAIDYVLSCQKEDGLFSYQIPEPYFQEWGASRTAAYNHAIAGLMLGEVYGHVSGARARKVGAAIGKAILFTRALQVHPKLHAEDAGGWLAAHPYGSFGESMGRWGDKFFCSTYYCSQAAAQLGGHDWETIFPPIVEVFLKGQLPEGAFPPEPRQGDAAFGRTYSTAMAVLSLTPAFQLLPVYQR